MAGGDFYGFHEVKLFLATQVYDAGRKVEALRKRALHGSGIIGKAPLSDVSESWYNALTFTDMIIALDVVYKSYELTAFECATDWARSDFDRDLFARLAEDSKRHLEYGLKHLEWYNRYAERAEMELPIFFIKAEGGLASEMAQSPIEREALACSMPMAVERLDAGGEEARSCARSSTRFTCIACTITDSTGSARRRAFLVSPRRTRCSRRSLPKH